MHSGLTDSEDTYLSAYEDDYPTAIDKLKLFNFKRDKVMAYDRAQQAINQGLVIFPVDANTRNELEIEQTDEDGNISIKYEKLDLNDLAFFNELSLVKEELIATQKIKKPNGTIQYGLSPQAISRGTHDDRADTAVMMISVFMELRAERALKVEIKQSEYKKIFETLGSRNKRNNNPFGGGRNPFANGGNNPFR